MEVELPPEDLVLRDLRRPSPLPLLEEDDPKLSFIQESSPVLGARCEPEELLAVDDDVEDADPAVYDDDEDDEELDRPPASLLMSSQEDRLLLPLP